MRPYTLSRQRVSGRPVGHTPYHPTHYPWAYKAASVRTWGFPLGTLYSGLLQGHLENSRQGHRYRISLVPVVRGAAVLCAIIQFVVRGDNVRENNIGVS